MVRKILIGIVLVFSFSACKNWNVDKAEPIRVENPYEANNQKQASFKAKTVENDPSNTVIYTLDNGLKLYLSPNKTAPKIQTIISVNAGSVHDPSNATGLAHYLEHMLFKGTDKIGTVNYEKEAPLIHQIEDLFESLRNTQDTLRRKTIYLKIDSLSQEAAKYAAPNELTELYRSIGANGTNAFTGSEYTGYINTIPANQLENWLKIEQERFRKPVLRLFHTELEAVYEEKNMGLDNPDRQMYYAMMEALFPTHNYGQQSTIGTVEHLKSPSMKAIHEYFYAHYVPNNMAVHLAGDFDPKAAVKLIEQYFGDWEPKDPPVYSPEAEKPIEEKIVVKMETTEAPKLSIAYRFNNEDKENRYLATMVDMLLSNSKAGLIDVNINQPKKAVGAYSYHYPMKDYTLHVMGGKPTDGQSLKDLEALILQELEKIKNGDFPDWLPEAVVNNLKMDELKQLRSNRQRTMNSLDAFSKKMTWEEKVSFLDRLAQIGKEDIVAFAQKNYGDNYVAVYREQVEETERLSVAKPPITPIQGNEDNQSDFAQNFLQNNQPESLIVDTTTADQLIVVDTLKNTAEFLYRKNSRDELFDAKLYFPKGSYQSKTIATALDLVQRCGTDSLSAREISEAWYKMGIDFSMGAADNYVVVSFKGLSPYFEDAINLFKHQLKHCKLNEEIWSAVLASKIQARKNMLASKKDLMWTGMKDFLVYGKNSPVNHQLSNEALRELNPNDLIEEARQHLQNPYRYTYYGEDEIEEVKDLITKHFDLSKNVNQFEDSFDRKSTKENEIYFVDQNTQQAEILMMSNGAPMNDKEWAIHELFNEYFGGSMSSIVFQEMREKKALAYSVYAGYSSPKKANDPRYLIAYIGTQADKYEDAMQGMLNLLNDLIIDSARLEQGKKAIIQDIESSRIMEYSAINQYLSHQERGVPFNKNHLIYKNIPELTIADLKNYFNKYIKNQNFRIGVIGPKSEIDLEQLSKFGKVKEIERTRLFPFE